MTDCRLSIARILGCKIRPPQSPDTRDLTAQRRQPHILAKQVSKQTKEGAPSYKYRHPHAWIKAGTLATGDYRLGMLRPPPANRHVINRHIDEADNAHYRCQNCRAPRIDDVTPQHQVSHKQKPQD